MKRTLSLLVAACSTFPVFSQTGKSYKIPLSGEVVNSGGSFEILYELTPAQLQYKLPAIDKKRGVAWFSLWLGYLPEGQRMGVIVEGALTSDPRYYFDTNFNLDFTDDGAPRSFSGKSLRIDVPGGTGRGVVHYVLSRLEVNPANLAALNQMAAYAGNSAAHLPPQTWLMTTGISRTGNFYYNGKDYTIGLSDRDFDGNYTNMKLENGNYWGDLLVLNEGKRDTVSPVLGRGGYRLDCGYLPLGAEDLEVTEVDAAGKYLKLTPVPAGRRSYLAPGDTIRRLLLPMVDGGEMDLFMLKGNGKLKYIESWATWCTGCLMIIPEMRDIHNKFADKIDIISINNQETNLPGIRKIVSGKKMDWPQLLGDEATMKYLGVQSMPYGILFDEHFRIMELFVFPSQVRKILGQNR